MRLLEDMRCGGGSKTTQNFRLNPLGAKTLTDRLNMTSGTSRDAQPEPASIYARDLDEKRGRRTRVPLGMEGSEAHHHQLIRFRGGGAGNDGKIAKQGQNSRVITLLFQHGLVDRV